MRKFYANRLLQTLRKAGEEATAKGLTEEKLAELLADEIRRASVGSGYSINAFELSY
jgi:hypothetical protein